MIRFQSHHHGTDMAKANLMVCIVHVLPFLHLLFDGNERKAIYQTLERFIYGAPNIL